MSQDISKFSQFVEGAGELKGLFGPSKKEIREEAEAKAEALKKKNRTYMMIGGGVLVMFLMFRK